jgi:hypothetical protein
MEISNRKTPAERWPKTILGNQGAQAHVYPVPPNELALAIGMIEKGPAVSTPISAATQDQYRGG